MVSPVHAFEGRPAGGPRPDPVPVGRSEVEVRAELGIVGDRYFGQTAHRNAAVTFFDAASLDALAEALELPAAPDPLLVRRNITLRGYPVDSLSAHRAPDGTRVPGRRFTLDSGSGPIGFQAHRPANPCAWMDTVLAPGAFKGLRGHGGIRTTPTSSGILRLGPAQLSVLD
ncbi:molybdenum cofactor biosysynthesis protein [Kribbella turkmenica]|uniref:Molybdenum cofactor biosysynthesis protein n=2 Tax=Kribbella turkmenica TaxID=2530375 RepID=A0A4R4XA02_9ACTN|nr:molybdenum cofactor biosysynthesis protein [Kribbella turkmenica]